MSAVPPLSELQRLFWQAIAEPEGPAGVPALTAVVRPTARLGIYAEMYFWRLVEALREDYPKTAECLGCDGFASLVREYLRAHPSVSPSLRQLGGAMAGFVAASAAAVWPPFLADLVRLEWARVEAFDAPDVVPLGLADLRTIPPEEWGRLRFRLAPGCVLLRSEWPLHELWDAPVRPAAPVPTTLRVWRQGYRVFHARLGPDEAMALERVAAGDTFAQICEALADGDLERVVPQAGGLLARWLEDELLVGA
ncbi:MAG: DNA-binding domain-containing protein [Candidatus Binatia bacterium]